MDLWRPADIEIGRVFHNLKDKKTMPKEQNHKERKIDIFGGIEFKKFKLFLFVKLQNPNMINFRLDHRKCSPSFRFWTEFY